jgi:hypothetical protein
MLIAAAIAAAALAGAIGLARSETGIEEAARGLCKDRFCAVVIF